MIDTKLRTLSPASNFAVNNGLPKWKKIDILETPSVYFLNLANGTEYKIITFKMRNVLFFGIERKGCFFFNSDWDVCPSYVADKLSLDNCLNDKGNVADWLNTQLGFKDAPEFGFYIDNYCVDSAALQDNIRNYFDS